MKTSERVDVELAIIAGNKVPCICPRQFDESPPKGDVVAVVNSREMIVAHVECRECGRPWRRFDHE